MHDAVREEHVGLDDARGRVRERDVLARAVDREGERLAGRARVVLRAREQRRVHGRAVDDLRARGSAGVNGERGAAYVVEEDRVERGAVRREALQRRVRGGKRGVVGREEREAVVAGVERVEEGDVARRVRRRVIERERRALEHRLERAQRELVRGHGDVEALRDLEDVVDDEDGEVAEGRRVDHGRVVALVQDVGLVVCADRPSEDLGLATLEVNGLVIVVQRLTKGHVRVMRRNVRKVSGNDVVREDVREGIRVLCDIAGGRRPCTWLTQSPTQASSRLTSLVVGGKDDEGAAVRDAGKKGLALGGAIQCRRDGNELGEALGLERAQKAGEEGRVLSHRKGGRKRHSREGGELHRVGRVGEGEGREARKRGVQGRQTRGGKGEGEGGLYTPGGVGSSSQAFAAMRSSLPTGAKGHGRAPPPP